MTLLQTLHNRLRQRDVALLLCGAAADLRKALASSGLEAQIGAGRIFSDLPSRDASRRDAIQAAYDLLGDARCATCPRRQESAGQPWDYMI